MTLSGRLVSAASLVMEIDEVFVARINFRAAHAVEIAEDLGLDLKFLARRFDDEIAVRKLGAIGTGSMRPSVAALSSAVILFLATSRSRFLPMVSRPRSRKRCSTSHSST